MKCRFAFPRILLVVALSAIAGACVDSLHSQPTEEKWTTGFWYWRGNSPEPASARVVPDVLFFQAGRISRYPFRSEPERWEVSREIPESLPPAREYWAVFRYEDQGVPGLSAAPEIVAAFSDILASARQRKLGVAGIQLDIDSPTGELHRYADLLREIRKGLPAGMQLSITALLDWFRPGTSIAGVIEETDEFVPQFYDVAAAGDSGGWKAIAAKIDPAEWGPKFNRFGKRFRIGVSSFGRARFVEAAPAATSGFYGVRLFSDLKPLDIALNTAFSRQVSRSEADELVLTYRATRRVRIGYSDIGSGDAVQFVVPTPESVRSAVDNAKRIGGHCAGIVFFRWPAANEDLVLPADEALMAAGLLPRVQKPAGVELQDGRCAAVSCVDLVLVNAQSRSIDSLRYVIRSSTELEYFLPQERVPARMTGPSEIEMVFPPFTGVSRILLGRAVSERRAEFRVELAQ